MVICRLATSVSRMGMPLVLMPIQFRCWSDTRPAVPASIQSIAALGAVRTGKLLAASSQPSCLEI